MTRIAPNIDTRESSNKNSSRYNRLYSPHFPTEDNLYVLQERRLTNNNERRYVNTFWTFSRRRNNLSAIPIYLTLYNNQCRIYICIHVYAYYNITRITNICMYISYRIHICIYTHIYPIYARIYKEDTYK